ncbi:MAG: hypothetical protein MUF86_06990, partial [Akkermansiaceae bacterium]|nr:hypothetical protein [Akkermansiaceae bacterium]
TETDFRGLILGFLGALGVLAVQISSHSCRLAQVTIPNVGTLHRCHFPSVDEIAFKGLTFGAFPWVSW